MALAVTGAGFVLLGGVVAAVTGPLDLEDGSWLAAYLVLVCGAAQYAMGRFRWFQPHGSHSSTSSVWWQFGSWNAGNAAVILGTLAVGTLAVVAGSGLLFFALLIALRASWHSGIPPGGAGTLLVWSYRILLVILAVSIPVGILLSALRH